VRALLVPQPRGGGREPTGSEYPGLRLCIRVAVRQWPRPYRL